MVALKKKIKKSEILDFLKFKFRKTVVYKLFANKALSREQMTSIAKFINNQINK